VKTADLLSWRKAEVSLRFWTPVARDEVVVPVADLDDVLSGIDASVVQYRQAGAGLLPGVSLWPDLDTPADSLTIGVAPDGWAIVHTDGDLLRKVTREGGPRDREPRKVKLDDLVELPADSFIDREVAVGIVETWMRGQDAAQSALFSSELFGL
jgi:hypothetical protein